MSESGNSQAGAAHSVSQENLASASGKAPEVPSPENAMLRSQTCVRPESQRAELVEAKEVSGSPTCMGPFQDLGELKPYVHFLFLKEGIPKLYLFKPHETWP